MLPIDMPGETTVEHVGTRSVPLRTTGHEKSRFTVVLAAMADGRKLKPFVVLKGVRPNCRRPLIDASPKILPQMN